MAKTGDALSILGYGCMRLPQRNGRIDRERATRQLYYAIDRGVNYLDTAVPYHMGASEPFLGRILHNGYRSKVKLATKLPHWSIRTSEDLDAMLAAQLANLQTDRIDYYLVHNLQSASWQRLLSLGVEDFLDRARVDGRIGHAGFSSHEDTLAFKALVNAYDWEFCQIQFNILNEQIQAGRKGLQYAAGKGLGVIVMGPLQGGRLAPPPPDAVQAIWDEAETKRTPVEWMLRWVWNHPEVSVVLSGMNEEEHIDENLRIASEAHPESLTDEELAVVERVKGVYQSRIRVHCTKCRYCMPCPAGVDIPTCFEVYNSLHLFDRGRLSTRVDYMIQAGGLLGGHAALASQCVGCGQCEKVCPQHLPVRDLLRDVVREFEFVGLKPLIWTGRQFVTVQGRVTMRQAQKARTQT
jgi:predicted aldo/keto reductase-like oxidoreductase